MATGRPAIVDRLREATRELHAAVENEAAVLEGGRDRYLWFVARQYGFHAPLEPRLVQAFARVSGGEGDTSLAAVAAGLDLERRRRAHLFAADLLHFDVSPSRLPRCAALPRVDAPARALGALYVLEGSTLGGAFVLAQLGRRLGISPTSGASGIAPYGHGLAAMWTGYAAALDGFVRARPDEETEIVDGARETFEKMLAWLREPAAPIEVAVAAL